MGFCSHLLRNREIRKMKKLCIIGMLFIILLSQDRSLGQPPKSSQKLEITSASLLMSSLQLAEKANQLYTIKDNLVKSVQAKKSNLTVQEKYIIDVVSELKHIATISYFESKLLGVVFIVKEEFKVPYVNARIPELEESISSTESSLQPLHIASSGIYSDEVLQQIDKAKEILISLKQLYMNSIELLQRIRMENGVEAEKIQP